MNLFRRLFGPGKGRTVAELAERIGVEAELLRRVEPSVRYREFAIPRRSGGERRISAPDDRLKDLQRLILRRILGPLKAHPAAHGFEAGRSIVTNARPHVGKAIVIRADLVDFFPSTTARRVKDLFLAVGWNREAADLLTKLCTHRGALPQGAPSSPRLANLVNRGMDARLAALAAKFGGDYTRYADDLTFSLPAADPAPRPPAPAGEPSPSRTSAFLFLVASIVEDCGYRIHARRKKPQVLRRHQPQRVTGLTVNDRVAVPREIRRRLRAIEHRISTGREATLTPEQLRGWRAYLAMVGRAGA